jgi:seryl-tRNA synthetase
MRKYKCTFILTEDEKKACIELIQKMEAEKEKEEKLQKTKNEISFAIAAAIPEIGIEEVKRSVRELNRELRELPIEES